MDANGSNGESRLDRIERLLERHIIDNQEAHASFAQEHQLLLRAQVVMTDNMSKLETKMLETSEKLDAIIRIVDGFIRKNGAEGVTDSPPRP